MTMRRFIAGAVCPTCRAVDRIVLEEFEGGRRRRCVSCGHMDTLLHDAPAEPATRLGRRPRAAEAPTPVRIVDPTKDRS